MTSRSRPAPWLEWFGGADVLPDLETGSALEPRLTVLAERVSLAVSALYEEVTLCGPPFVARLMDGVRWTEVPEKELRALCEEERRSPCPLFSVVSAKVLVLLASPWILLKELWLCADEDDVCWESE